MNIVEIEYRMMKYSENNEYEKDVIPGCQPPCPFCQFANRL